MGIKRDVPTGRLDTKGRMIKVSGDSEKNVDVKKSAIGSFSSNKPKISGYVIVDEFSGKSHTVKIDEEFSDVLGSMFEDAPDDIKESIELLSDSMDSQQVDEEYAAYLGLSINPYID